jgi:hypothetical protein
MTYRPTFHEGEASRTSPPYSALCAFNGYDFFINSLFTKKFSARKGMLL